MDTHEGDPTKSEVIDRIGCHPTTVERWLRTGKLTGYISGRIRYIHRESFDAILAEIAEYGTFKAYRSHSKLTGGIPKRCPRCTILINKDILEGENEQQKKPRKYCEVCEWYLSQ